MHRERIRVARRRRTACLAAGLVLAVLTGCVKESHRTVATPTVATYGTSYDGPRHVLAVGKFDNRSTYMRGMFAEGPDQLGGQAKTILKTHLQQTGRFTLVDRENMREIEQESEIRGEAQDLRGAVVVVTGDVSEFGRRVTGDTQLFGILGSGKRQLAYAKVSLNVIDVRTSAVIYAVQGAGEYVLSNREVAGFGTVAGYDATLNGKVLNLAITDAVNKLVAGLEAGAWHPSGRS
jgi:curli biogenesis system outer membrane secretion channel CsgG